MSNLIRFSIAGFGLVVVFGCGGQDSTSGNEATPAKQKASSSAENPASPPQSQAGESPRSSEPGASTMSAMSAMNDGAAGGAASKPAAMNPSPAPSTPVSNKPAPASMPPNEPNTAAAAQEPAAADGCGLHTQWPGDEYCIKPPPPDKGFQIHIGPSDYDNPDAKFLLQPGTETNENFPAVSGNSSEIYYYVRQYRMRPGSHHLILTAGSGGFGGKRLGGSQNLARDNPDKGVIPPEDQHVGMKLGASTALNVNLHYVNFGEKPLLKEAWVNVWYRDAKDVTEPANEMYSFAPINIAAGKHVLLRGVCPITKAGRILSHYGHRHANNQRFSTWRDRAGKLELIYEDYDWKEPLTLQYSSTVTNTPPDSANKIAGGWSGMLDLAAGDNIVFECDIVNNSDHTFRGANEAEDDEMCILIGDTVQTTVPAACTYTTTEL
jgi:hypothetical protein